MCSWLPESFTTVASVFWGGRTQAGQYDAQGHLSSQSVSARYRSLVRSASTSSSAPLRFQIPLHSCTERLSSHSCKQMREQLILTGNPEDTHTQMANYASDTSSFSRTDAPSQASAAVFFMVPSSKDLPHPHSYRGKWWVQVFMAPPEYFGLHITSNGVVQNAHDQCDAAKIVQRSESSCGVFVVRVLP